MVYFTLVARGRDFLLIFLILGFYPCKPPGVTESELGGHMNFVKLNKWKWKWKLHGT